MQSTPDDSIRRLADHLISDHLSAEDVLPELKVSERVGRYEVEGELGRGGMGIVYAAYDPVLDRPVAIKFLRSVRELGPGDRERFRQEAELASALKHEAILRTLDVGESDGRPYIVMERLEGKTLADARAKGLSVWEAVSAVGDVAEALAYAHQEGVVHRDVKPSNIAVRTASGRGQLLDFGLATASLDASERSVVGTPTYMAPELVVGSGGAPADVYALGVVLYELLTGKPPFTATSTQLLFSQIVSKPAPPLVVADTPFAQQTARIAEACLERDPDQRPSAAEVASSLERALTAPKCRPRGRAPSLGVLVGAISAGVCALALIAWSRGELPEPALSSPREEEPPPSKTLSPVPPTQQPLARQPLEPELPEQELAWWPGVEGTDRIRTLERTALEVQTGVLNGRHNSHHTAMPFKISGASRVVIEFELEGRPAWLRVGLAGKAWGGNDARLDVRLNDRILAQSYRPPEYVAWDPFSATELARQGLNRLEISLRKDSPGFYWLLAVRVRSGSGMLPDQLLKWTSLAPVSANIRTVSQRGVERLANRPAHLCFVEPGQSQLVLGFEVERTPAWLEVTVLGKRVGSGPGDRTRIELRVNGQKVSIKPATPNYLPQRLDATTVIRTGKNELVIQLLEESTTSYRLRSVQVHYGFKATRAKFPPPQAQAGGR